MTEVLIIAAAIAFTTLLVLSHLVSNRCRSVEAYRRVLFEARRIERQRLDMVTAGGSVRSG